jgi:hypothetical protein
MKRGTLNFIIDLISFINMVCLAVTGFIIKYILPPGSGGLGRGFRGGREPDQIKELWSMTRHEWGYIHFCLALVFLYLMVLHIVLHWSWIKSYFKSLLSIGRKTSN